MRSGIDKKSVSKSTVPALKQATIQKILEEIYGSSINSHSNPERIDAATIVAYAEAELDGHDAARLYPNIHAILLGSLPEMQEYQALKRFFFTARAQQLRQPTRPAHFDFSYLPPFPAPVQSPIVTYMPIWRIENVSQVVIEFTSDLMTFLLPTTPKAAFTFERSQQSEMATLQISLPNLTDDLNLQINIQPMQTISDTLESRLYQIVVETDIPSLEGWPNLANSTVNLKQADTFLKSRLTDPFGKAVFDNIPESILPELKFEVIPVRQN